MPTKLWKSSVIVILIGLIAPAHSAAGNSPGSGVILTIHVHNYADVGSSRLAEAEKTAASIFRRAGVETHWQMGPNHTESSDESSSALSHLWLDILPPAMANHLDVPDTAMGLAPGEGPDRQHVYVFYERVTEFTQRQIAEKAEGSGRRNLRLPDGGQLLGAIMAHELGHIVLEMAGHSKAGIMKGGWELKDLQEIAYESLDFTPPQVASIRAEVIRRNGSRAQVDLNTRTK